MGLCDEENQDVKLKAKGKENWTQMQKVMERIVFPGLCKKVLKWWTLWMWWYSMVFTSFCWCVCAETQKTSSALTQHINSTLVIHKIRENQEKSSTLRAQNMRPTFQTRKMSSILETFGVLNQSIHVILGWMVLDEW